MRFAETLNPQLKESLSHLENEVSVLLCLEEGVLVRDRVADDEALPAAHVLLPHRRELHLPRSVQDVQQARLPVDHRPLQMEEAKELMSVLMQIYYSPLPLPHATFFTQPSI